MLAGVGGGEEDEVGGGTWRLKRNDGVRVEREKKTKAARAVIITNEVKQALDKAYVHLAMEGCIRTSREVFGDVYGEQATEVVEELMVERASSGNAQESIVPVQDIAARIIGWANKDSVVDGNYDEFAEEIGQFQGMRRIPKPILTSSGC